MKNPAWLLIGIILLSSCDAEQSSSEYLNDARGYMDAGDYKSAVIQLKNLLKESPLNAEGRFLLGKAYINLGEGASAAKELQRAEDLGVPQEKWIVLLAKAYLLMGKPREMLEKVHPDPTLPQPIQARVYTLLAMAQLALRNVAAADENVTRALELDSESVDVCLAASRLAIAKKDYAAATKYAQQALDLDKDTADAWLVLGEVQRVEGNNDQAIEYFGKALAISPNYLPAQLARATIYIILRNFELAEKDLNQVRESAGEVPMALYLQGAIDFERKSYSDAKNMLEKVVNVIPDHLPSLLLLGTIAYYQNQYETAYSHLSRYVNAVPDYLPAIKLLAATTIKNKQHQEAVEILESTRRKFPDEPQLLALLGSAYLNAGNYDQAIGFLSKATEAAPDAAAIRTQLAMSYLGAGSLDQAVGELETAVDLGKDLGHADIMLVMALIKQKSFDAAIKMGVELSEKMPDDPVPVNLLAAAYMAKGDKESARKYWNKTLEIQPGFVSAAMNLAKLELNTNNYSLANNLYRQVLEHHPGNINALIGLAELARIQNKQEEQQKWLDIALKEKSGDIQDRLVLAKYLVSQGDLQKANDVVNTLKTRYPDNPLILRQFGMIQLASGNPKAAISVFEQLLKEYPKNPELHSLLAQSLVRTGSKNKAREEWEQALKLDSGYLSAAAALIQLSLSENRYDEALENADKIILQHPQRSIGYQLKGDVLRAKEDQVKALAAYRKGFKLEANGPLAQRIFITARVLGQKSDSYKSLSDWIDEHPEDISSQVLLGTAYIEDDKKNDAIRVYENVRAKQPKNGLILNNLAWLYQEIGDDRAIDLAEQALAVAPSDPDVIDTVGWILMQNGKVERSVTLLQQAAQKAPENKTIQYHYSESLLKAGKKAEARKQLQTLLAGQAEFPERAKAEKLLNSI